MVRFRASIAAVGIAVALTAGMTTPASAAATGKAAGAAAPIAAAAAAVPAALVPAPAKPKKVKRTVVKKKTAFTKKGNMRVAVVPVDDPGGCGASEVALAKNVYVCGPSAVFFPACWVVRKALGQRLMVCLRSPDEKTAYAWWTPSGTALPPAPKPDGAMPWRLVLEGGAKCVIRMGGAYGAPPPGYAGVTHNCDGKGGVQAVLAKEFAPVLNTSKPRYRVKVLKSNGSVKTAGVKKVVYAGVGPKPWTLRTRTVDNCLPSTEWEALAEAETHGMEYFSASCTDEWVMAEMTDEEVFVTVLMQKSGGSWHVRDIPEVCATAKGLPAQLLHVCPPW